VALCSPLCPCSNDCISSLYCIILHLIKQKKIWFDLIWNTYVPLSPSSINLSWEGNRRSGVALAIRITNNSGISNYELTAFKKRDEHPVCAPALPNRAQSTLAPPRTQRKDKPCVFDATKTRRLGKRRTIRDARHVHRMFINLWAWGRVGSYTAPTWLSG